MMIDPRTNRFQFLLLFTLASIAMLTGLGIAPLFLEEPRRALVAMEMMYNNDLIHTTIHGKPYYNKPPLFNWIILVGFKWFGYQDWILRFITVSSHLAIGYLVYKMGAKYFSKQSGVLAAGLYLAGADILFYFSLIGEIDIFFSLLIVAGWFSYFHFSSRDKFKLAYLLFYFFMALGFLTKGLPAVLFAGFTMVGWHAYTGRFRKLFTTSHLLGVLVALLLVTLYFLPFLVQGDLVTLVSTLWGQSIERTEAQGFSKRVISFISFPILLLKDIMPAAIMLILFRMVAFRNYLKQYPLFAFCFVVFVSNIWVYWISPDSQSRYHYMFHPLLILMIVHFYVSFNVQSKYYQVLQKIFKGLSWLFLGVIVAGIIVVPMALPTKGISWILPVVLPLAASAFYLGKKFSWSPVYLAILLMLLLRLPYGYITSMERSQNSQASKDKKTGIAIAEIAGQSPVFLWDSTRISTTISYYMQRDLGRIVPYSTDESRAVYYILPDSVLQSNMLVKKQFLYQGNPFSLVWTE